MRIAGIGFRDEAGLESVLDALEQADATRADRLAIPARKAGHPLCHALAARGHHLVWITDEVMAATQTPTQSPIALRHYGTGSVAEAAALAGARMLDAGARLAGLRALSADRLATAALALTGDAS